MRQHYPLNSNGAEDAGQLPWKDGVPSTGVQGSYPGHAIITDVEAEVLAAIDVSGQARSGSDLAQLSQALGRGIDLGQFGGSANALAAALPNNVVFLALQPRTKFSGLVAATNTAGVTLALTGVGSTNGVAQTLQAALLRNDGAALQAGDLPVSRVFEVRYDGAAFRMVGDVASQKPSLLLGNGYSVVPTQYTMASLSAAASLPNNIETAVPFNISGGTVAGMWSSAAPSKVFIPAGIRRIRVQYELCAEANSTGFRKTRILVDRLVEGFGLPAARGTAASSDDVTIQGSAGGLFDLSLAGALDGTHYVELMATQNSGAPLNVRAANTWMAVELLG